MKMRTLALIATGLIAAALSAAAAAAVTTAPAHAGDKAPTPPPVRSTITGW